MPGSVKHGKDRTTDRRSARSIGLRIFGMAGLTSVGRPLVVSTRPLDLLLCAKDLFVAASA